MKTATAISALFLSAFFVSHSHAMGPGRASSILPLLERDPIEAQATTYHRDHEVLWNRLNSVVENSPDEDDFLLLQALVQKSIRLWDQLLACSEYDFAKTRQAYLKGTFCSSPVANEEITQQLSDLHADIGSFLATVRLPEPDPREQEAREANPFFQAFQDIWRKNQYTVSIPLNPLFNQILIEHLAFSPFFPGTDIAYWDEVLDRGRRSQRKQRAEYDQTYAKWLKESHRRIKSGDWRYISSPDLLQALQKNDVYDGLLPVAQGARNTLRLLGYNELHCQVFGLWPNASGVVIEQFIHRHTPIYSQHEDLGRGMEQDAIGLGIRYEMSCGQTGYAERAEFPSEFIHFQRNFAKRSTQFNQNGGKPQ